MFDEIGWATPPASPDPLYLQFLEVVTNAANSSFGSAFAGAMVGALAANYFARRSETNARQTDRLRELNSAASFSLLVFQSALKFKKHANSVFVEYKKEKRRFEKHLESLKSGSAAGTKGFHMVGDFRTFEMFPHRAEAIVEFVVARGEAKGADLMASAFLNHSLQNLEASMKNRIEQISVLESLKTTTSPEDLIKRYFGFPTSTGALDERMSDIMTSLEQSTDDVIYYSLFLALDLANKAKPLAKKIGKGSLPAFSFQLDSTDLDKYFPDEADYPDFPLPQTL